MTSFAIMLSMIIHEKNENLMSIYFSVNGKKESKKWPNSQPPSFYLVDVVCLFSDSVINLNIFLHA